MKSIFRNSKHGIAAVLTLCIILGIAGTCVNIAVMAEEPTVATDETTAVAAEEITIATEESAVESGETVPELVPKMARGCSSVPQSAYSFPDFRSDGSVFSPLHETHRMPYGAY